MPKKEPIAWITINGVHVPIFEGETKEEAASRFIQEKQSVKIGDKEVGVFKTRKRVSQEELTNERIMSEIVGADSYANSEEYKELAREAGKNYELQQEIREKEKQLEEELKAETSIKPKEEYTDEDELNALLFGERSVKKYTEKGQALNEQLEGLKTQYREAEERWSEVTGKMHEMGKGVREKQLQEFRERDSRGEVSADLKDDYFGFAKDKTTTPYIDEMLENGKAFVVEMTPKHYIEECAYNIFTKEHSTLESTLRGRSAKDVAKYMTMMEEGVKFNTPYLNYKDEQQEGLHRAIAAYMLGIEMMPVVIVRKR